MALVLFPLFDGGIRDTKVEELRELGHGQGKVYALFTEVFAKSLGICWIAP